MILPSLKQASTDRRLRGAPLRVLVYLHGALEIGEYRVVKTWHVADRIGMNRAHVGEAIRILVALGYLREGPKKEHGVRSFMLIANPTEVVA